LHYYARLLDFPWVAFYRYRSGPAEHDLPAIAAHDLLFTIAAHKNLLARTDGSQ